MGKNQYVSMEMIEKTEITFMQTRLIRLASEEWHLPVEQIKMIISFCEESFIEAKQIFNKVVEFDSHNSSSPFLRCHYIIRKIIIHAKTKK